jgi:hypothetical protein
MANQPITETEINTFNKSFRKQATAQAVAAKLGITAERAKTILTRVKWRVVDRAKKPYTWGPRVAKAVAK